jgi:hypothetical protein
MAMTLEKVRDFHRKLATDHKAIPPLSEAHAEMADAIDAHLSAQAKVQVTDEDVERSIEAHDSVYSHMDRGHDNRIASMRAALESFAARLSQGDCNPIATECPRCKNVHEARVSDPACKMSQGAQGNAPDDASFVCYLIDKHEKDVIYEESLHGWFADFLKDPRYSQGQQSSGISGEVARGVTTARLDKPALVGHVQFGVGIPWSTVIGAAQRAYEWKDDKMSPEQIAAFYIAFPHIAPSHEKVKEAAERAAVPEGWVLVPREPTLEMLRAGFLSEEGCFDIETPSDAPGLVYRAMLSAAPTLGGKGGADHG